MRLSTTMHKLLTFNISEISSNSVEKLSLLPDFSLSLVLFKFPDVQSQGRRISLALFSHQKEKCLGPGQSSPEIFLSSEAKDLVVTVSARNVFRYLYSIFIFAAFLVILVFAPLVLLFD